MDTILMYLLVPIIWFIEGIFENWKSLLVGGLIGAAVLAVLGAVSQAHTQRELKEERLQKRVDDLDHEMTNMQSELQETKSRLDDIERVLRPSDTSSQDYTRL
jgi:prefoldin subunit 5